MGFNSGFKGLKVNGRNDAPAGFTNQSSRNLGDLDPFEHNNDEGTSRMFSSR
jgi:hypothetical protein